MGPMVPMLPLLQLTNCVYTKRNRTAFQPRGSIISKYGISSKLIYIGRIPPRCIAPVVIF